MSIHHCIVLNIIIRYIFYYKTLDNFANKITVKTYILVFIFSIITVWLNIQFHEKYSNFEWYENLIYGYSSLGDNESLIADYNLF